MQSSRRKAPGRVVAIGDVHGDLQAARRALRLARAIDESDTWIGGNLTIVQTGDVLDRGDQEREVMELFFDLSDKAQRAGGAILRLHGNHEIMNVMGDFRYVTKAGFSAFAPDPKNVAAESPIKARATAFSPGGPVARRLANNAAALVVGNTAFVHGGIEPQFANGLDELNRETRCYLAGYREAPPEALVRPDGPLWSRLYSEAESQAACDTLGQALAKLGVERMVVGHTPQEKGITSACDGRVWRIDTGMAMFYGGPTEVLELRGDKAVILRYPP